MKIQEIIKEDGYNESDILDEKKQIKNKSQVNKNEKDKSSKKDKKNKELNRKNSKKLKLEIKDKEKELLSNKQQLLKSSDIQKRRIKKEFSKETPKKMISILNKSDNGITAETITVVENLYMNNSSEELEDSNSDYSSSEEKQHQMNGRKIFKPRKIEKKPDPKEKQKELKNKAKEFSKKVKLEEEQKLKNKITIDKKDFIVSTIESSSCAAASTADNKYNLRKINNKYFHSDKNKNFIKLLEKYFNMEKGPINMERIEKILKDLYQQNRIPNYADFYQEIKEMNKKIKILNEEKTNNRTSDNMLNIKTNPQITQSKYNRNNENNSSIKLNPIRTSSLPKNLNSVCNYDYLLKDCSHHQEPIKGFKHKLLLSQEKNHSSNKNAFYPFKHKNTDNIADACYYQKTCFSLEKTEGTGQEEDDLDDAGVFIDENFLGKLKDNIKKTLKETDNIIMESGKIKKDIIKSNHHTVRSSNNVNSLIKPRNLSNTMANLEIKDFDCSKKLEIKKQKFSSSEKINLHKTFKYKNLKTDDYKSNKLNFNKRSEIGCLSNDVIEDEDKLFDTAPSNNRNTESNNNKQFDLKCKKKFDDECIYPINKYNYIGGSSVRRFDNIEIDFHQNNFANNNCELKNEINKTLNKDYCKGKDSEASVSNIKPPIIKKIKVINNREVENEQSQNNVKDLNSVLAAKSVLQHKGNNANTNEYFFENEKNKGKLNGGNNVNTESDSLLNKTSERKRIRFQAPNDIKDSSRKINKNINNHSNNIYLHKNDMDCLESDSNIMKTESNEILNYKNLLENLGVYKGIKNENNKMDSQAIFNNTNISITIKKKNYYFENQAENRKGKSIIKDIKVLKDEKQIQNEINKQGKLSESTIESFNYKENLNLKLINEPQDKNNINYYTNYINNKHKDNFNLAKEKNKYLTEISNAESCKTTNDLLKTETLNLTESRDSGFLISNDLKSIELINVIENQNTLNELLNKQEKFKQNDFKGIILNKNTTANSICQNKTEDENKIKLKLNLRAEDSSKKPPPVLTAKKTKNDFNLNDKDNVKLIKVDKQNIQAIIMTYLAETQTSFYFKNQKFKITKNNLVYDIELTKVVTNQNEKKAALNSSRNSYFIKFVLVKGNKSSFTEEISKVQNLLIEQSD